jgi:hypothetical protein
LFKIETFENEYETLPHNPGATSYVDVVSPSYVDVVSASFVDADVSDGRHDTSVISAQPSSGFSDVMRHSGHHQGPIS